MIEIKSKRVCFLVDKVTDLVIPFSFNLLLILQLLIF